MPDVNIQEVNVPQGANIKVIGVGGAGGNMINHMIRQNFNTAETIVANTDAQDVTRSLAQHKIVIGQKLNNGLGAGMNPEIGKLCAEESIEDIKAELVGADMVFVAAGLGGGTGTGASSIVANTAQEIGALTVAVVSIPFLFEKKPRMNLALKGLEELRKVTNSIIIVNNENLLKLEGVNILNAFATADKILSQAVISICDIIMINDKNTIINVDFNDVRAVMNHRGIAVMSIGEAKGENSTSQAFKNAITSPVIDAINIEEAKSILLNFTIHPNNKLFNMDDAVKDIDENATCIYGLRTDDTLDEDQVKIVLIATGFDEDIEQQAEKPIEQHIEEPKKVGNGDVFDFGRQGGFELRDDEDLDIAPALRHQLD